jgi:ribosomal protein S12 methylthiotransferase
VPAVHFRSLGCPKNQLDTEVMLGSLALAGYQIAENLEDADVAVVNTCSFIETAREESIEAILELADHREKGRLRALVVAGCLPQRYGSELAKELPEVDAFVGTAAFPEIPKILGDALAGKSRGVYVEAGRTHLYDDASPRLLIGPGHSAYVKIAEGCDRICAFCAIPGIRGKFQSRSLESLVRELAQLAEAGVREVNLVAQDSTSWGKDQPGRPKLAELVRGLDAVEGLDWIRLLYLYPSAVDDELIEAFGSARRVLPYVDVPLQHASDAMLKAMRRGTTAARQRKLVERLRAGIPNLTLRTTVIVGFPGETDADFEALCDFAKESRFDRLGVFRYSDEEGTAGKDLPNKVPRSVSRARYKKLTTLQARIMGDTLAAQVGREAAVLVDSVLGRDRAIARFASQAPEIDGVTHLTTKKKLAPGQMVRAQVTGVRAGVDLEAREL